MTKATETRITELEARVYDLERATLQLLRNVTAAGSLLAAVRHGDKEGGQ
jgi:hypothetical protein